MLQAEHRWVVHAGLVMINHNSGSNLIARASTGTAVLAYRKLGFYFSTNISSTPSIVEAFSNITHKAWPSPKMQLIKPPRGYRQVAESLVDNYVRHNFMAGDQVEFDARRFVLRSSSQKMGFHTNIRQISRPTDFQFMNFCFIWLDYEKEEDMVQVGVVDWPTYCKIKLWRTWDKLQSRKQQPRAATDPSKQLVGNLNQKTPVNTMYS